MITLKCQKCGTEKTIKGRKRVDCKNWCICKCGWKMEEVEHVNGVPLKNRYKIF